MGPFCWAESHGSHHAAVKRVPYSRGGTPYVGAGEKLSKSSVTAGDVGLLALVGKGWRGRTDSLPSVTIVRRIKAPPAKVYAAISRPKLMRQGWGPRCRPDAQHGGGRATRRSFPHRIPITERQGSKTNRNQ